MQQLKIISSKPKLRPGRILLNKTKYEEMKEEGNQMEFWNKANVINNKLSLKHSFRTTYEMVTVSCALIINELS